MKVKKFIGIQSIVIRIVVQFILVTAQRFGDEQKNNTYLESQQTYKNSILNEDSVNSELENIFSNKYFNNGTRRYKKNRNRHLSQKIGKSKEVTKSKKISTDSVPESSKTEAPHKLHCSMNANFSKSPFPFCWNEKNSNSYQLKNTNPETNAGPAYVWNLHNINYNFYFPVGDASSLQQLIKDSQDIKENEKERKEDWKHLLIYPSKNPVSLKFTNINNIFSGKSKPIKDLSHTNIENTNKMSNNKDIKLPEYEGKQLISQNLPNHNILKSGNSKDGNKATSDRPKNNEVEQNYSFSLPILKETTESIHLPEITSSTHASEDIDEILLGDIKASITQMHSKYFSVVSRQLSQKSKAGLGRDTLSFVISPLWLVLTMIQLSAGARGSTLGQIERVTQFHHNNEHKLQALRLLVSKFPKNTRQIRLFGYTRLTIDSKLKLSSDFQKQAYSSMGMNVSSLNMDDIEVVSEELNRQVQNDTDNCMKRSFDVSDLEYERPRAALWNAAYLRAAWRSAPTVLNDSSAVHLVNGSTGQLRMYRLNDVMRIATVNEWNATVLEIPYKARRLRQVVVMPHDPQNLLAMENEMMKQRDLLGYLEPKFKETRVEVTLPKYTLEMTLLLPTKLKEMGMESIVTPKANFEGIWSGAGGYVTHAVQHVKFWAEEGRGAFKDDGQIWDPIPDIKLKVNNPYFFLVRLDDVVLMSGHFAI